uniref:kelch repeat and BTB domain-containing protein 11-like n=1 Tax=Myxine glutinosa TaxID=7769 RepID=UPI00358EDF9C
MQEEKVSEMYEGRKGIDEGVQNRGEASGSEESEGNKPGITNGGKGKASAVGKSNNDVEEDEWWQLGDPDLLIEVEGRRLRAHKASLVAQSDYFRARSSRQVLSLRGLSLVAVRSLLRFLHTGHMQCTSQELPAVLAAARALQAPIAAQAAVDAVKKTVELGQCGEVLALAKRLALPDLKDAVYRVLSVNYLEALLGSGAFSRLSVGERDLVLGMRSRGRLLLACATLPAVSRETDTWRTSSQSSSRAASPGVPFPSSLTSVSVVAEETEEELRGSLHYYCSESDQWRHLAVLPKGATTKGCAICVLFNYVFVCGGMLGYGCAVRLSNQVFCYNPATATWCQLRPMNEARSLHKLVALDGCLYAIGGECLHSTERYDPRTNRWSFVDSLPRDSFAAAHEAVASRDGYIYITGGSLFHRMLRFAPRRRGWEECPRSGGKLSGRSTTLVAMGPYLYRFDVNRELSFTSIQRYHTVARLWDTGVVLSPAVQNMVAGAPFRCTELAGAIWFLSRAVTLQLRPMLGLDSNSCCAGSGKEGFEARAVRSFEGSCGLLIPFALTLPACEDMEEERNG